jgi:GNAT superfamily N-acetyltransferase
MKRSAAALTIHPLTPDRWPDFVRLFGEQGVGGGCWCMGWRLPSKQQYLRQKGEANKKAMHSLVRSGCVPGLLAYVDSEPVGWCAVAPREDYPALQRSPSRKAVDAQAVWSISCVYVARSYRRRHLSTKLIEAAVAYVRSRGGQIVEGYPVPVKRGVTSTNYAFTGFVSAFEDAGFTECLRRSTTRPIMRLQVERPHKRLKRTARAR